MNSMKTIVLSALLAVFALAIAGCSGAADNTAANQSPTVTPSNPVRTQQNAGGGGGSAVSIHPQAAPPGVKTGTTK